MAEAPTWTPAAGVTSHAGTPLPSDQVFFAPPPPEIGEVVSAWGTLQRGTRPLTQNARVAWTLAPLALITVLALLLRLGDAANGVLLFIGLGLTLYNWVDTEFRHTCTYTGPRGLARAVLRGSLEGPVTTERLLYEEVTDLRTKLVRHLTSGYFVGTDYSFEWSDARGAAAFTISGNHQTKVGDPGPESDYHFGHRAELAWSAHRAAGFTRELEEKGYITFRLDGGDSIKIGPGFLHLNLEHADQRVSAGEIDSFKLHDGVFTVRRKGTRWASWVFRFYYSKLPNARNFCETVEQVLGVGLG